MSSGGQFLSGALNLVGAITGGYFFYLAAFATNYYDAKRDRRKAIRRYNESLTDRLEMVERDPRLARTRCYGRVRNTEGAHRPFTHGPNQQDLAFFVSIAGHEIDGIEQWYFNDTPITLSGSGYVTTAPWTRSDTVTTSTGRTGDGTVSLPADYIPGTARATFQVGVGEDRSGGSATVVVTGSGPYTATVSGTGGSAVTVSYARFVGNAYARVRAYLGTSTQSIGGDLAAEFPGNLTTNDHCRGVAGGWIDLSYNEDVFPTGRPTVTALFRGAKVYDPRKDSTVSGGSGSHRLATPSTWEWTRNPALIAYDWAKYRWGMDVDPTVINVQDVMTAANACDVSTVFTLRKPDTTTTTVTLPRFQCDMVIPTDADPEDAMDRIVACMGGRWCWSGGTLRMRAGTLNSSVAAVDDSWLMEKVDSSGSPSGEPVVTAAQSVTRAQRWNRISGSCIDPDKRYQLLPYPAVEDSTLIAAKGERELEVDFDSVSSIAQAQHLASMAIRKAQAGQRLEIRCGLKGMDLELLDVFTLTYQSTRHNIVAKPYEVIGWKFDLNEGITIQAEEISAALFTVDAFLKGRDPAPDSSIRQPWDVEQLVGLTVSSGSVLDKSILTRTVVTWTAPTGSSILQGGRVEIQYALASAAVTDDAWQIWEEAGNASSAIIPGLRSSMYYLFRARFVQRIPLVRGPWSDTLRHQITGVQTVGTSGITPGAATPSVQFSTPADNTFSWSSGSGLVPPTSIISTLSYTNTTGRSVTVEAGASLNASGSGGAGTAGGRPAITFQLEDGTTFLSRNFWVSASTGSGSATLALTVANGATVNFRLYASLVTVGSGTWNSGSVTWDQASMRLTAIAA